MGRYVVSTNHEQKQMLEEIGLSSFSDLFVAVPDAVKLQELKLNSGLSEFEVRQVMEDIASKNIVFKDIFRGAGAYRHYIPAAVKQITSKEEFVTAYTPYQAEISQGVLQSIFEYQTEMCELTGMEASNASVYDGASAAAEAVAMCNERKRKVALVSKTTNPEVLKTIETYCFGNEMDLKLIDDTNGVTSVECLKTLCDDTVACVYVQSPNFFGLIEPVEEIVEVAHACGIKVIMGCNPIALAILKTPYEMGVDIAVGEGQPLGLPLAFGGPYLGFMTTHGAMVRKLPGRIVGQTEDHDGNRAFVLTLQAREQHIRREKASSNICSNQAHCALTAAVYLGIVGKQGLKDIAKQCASKAHYFKNELEKVGCAPKYQGEFFHEFVTVNPGKTDLIVETLKERGILAGLPLNEDEILWCCTEVNMKTSMDQVVSMIKEVA